MIEFVVSGLYFVQDENFFINPLLHHFMLAFVDSGLYFVQDENYTYYISVGYRPDPVKKVTDQDPAGQKSTDPDPQPWLCQSYQ